MLRVYSAGSLLDAHLVQNLLTEAGIETQILNEYAQGGTGEIPFNQTYPEVWLLNESDYTAARKIIASFEQRPDATATLVCSECKEINPESFEVCWRCGTELYNPIHD
jgi:uncharacterized paraquat-inducible protein A